jgi:hypothetical protein
MKLTESRSDETGENVYEVRISDCDVITVRLSREDRRIIDKCSKSDLVSDRLLLLYTIACAIEKCLK